MEPQAQPQNQPQPAVHDQPAQPVMDVKPPTPEGNPVPALAKPPAEADKPASAEAHIAHPKEAKKPTKVAPQPHTSTQTKSGNGGIIAATVIIVLGLAALAVYAYLKSQ